MSAGDSGRTLPRSYLYCPGDRPDRLARAGSRGADALIADLEDSVVPGRKDLARAAVADWLTAGPDNRRAVGPGQSGVAGRRPRRCRDRAGYGRGAAQGRARPAGRGR